MRFRKLITAVVFLLVLWMGVSWWLELPPFEKAQPVTFDSEQDDSKPFPEKAPFRFGSRALSGICSEYSLDTASVVRQMRALGIDAKPEWAIKRIAEENDMEVQAVFDVIHQIAQQND
jgi:hypothetical protein